MVRLDLLRTTWTFPTSTCLSISSSFGQVLHDAFPAVDVQPLLLGLVVVQTLVAEIGSGRSGAIELGMGVGCTCKARA